MQQTHLTLPIDSARDHVQGSLEAPLRLLEYGDYECPFCTRAYPVVKELQARLGGALCFVYRHFPRPEHPHARGAAEAAESAAAQGRFWPMHDVLYAHSQALEEPSLEHYARDVGLDLERFRADLTTHTYRERVHLDLESAVDSGAHGTPAFFVNDVLHEGTDSLEDLLRTLELARGGLGDAREQRMRDDVDEASAESFPASDAPGWIR